MLVLVGYNAVRHGPCIDIVVTNLLKNRRISYEQITSQITVRNHKSLAKQI